MVNIKILAGLEERVENLSATFNKETGKKKQLKMKNSVTEIINALEGVHSRLEEAEDSRLAIIN